MHTVARTSAEAVMAAAVAHVVTGSRGVPRRAVAPTSAIVVAEASAATSGGSAYSRARRLQRLRGVPDTAHLGKAGVLVGTPAHFHEVDAPSPGRWHHACTSVLDEQFATPPGMDLQITRAEWVGNTVEVEGRWGGEISSVHCDLFEGGEEQRVTDWWDRSVPPAMSWSKRTFAQLFVAAGRQAEEPIDPSTRYSVTC